MKFANVGTADRILRILLGAVLIALPFFVASIAIPSVPGIACVAIGAILIVTALVQFCPIYGIFGLRTRPRS